MKVNMVLPSYMLVGLLFFITVAVGVYVLTIRLTDDIQGTRAGRTFRAVYPVGALVLCGSLATVLYTSTRLLGSTSVFGMTLEHSSLLSTSLTATFVAFLVEVSVLIWVGVEAQKNSGSNLTGD